MIQRAMAVVFALMCAVLVWTGLFSPDAPWFARVVSIALGVGGLARGPKPD